MTLRLAQACPQSVQKPAVRRLTSRLHCPCPLPMTRSLTAGGSALSLGCQQVAVPRLRPPECTADAASCLTALSPSCHLRLHTPLWRPAAAPDTLPSSQSAAASSLECPCPGTWAWSPAELLREPLGGGWAGQPAPRGASWPRAGGCRPGAPASRVPPGSERPGSAWDSVWQGLLTAPSDHSQLGQRPAPRGPRTAPWLQGQAQGENHPRTGARTRRAGSWVVMRPCPSQDSADQRHLPRRDQQAGSLQNAWDAPPLLARLPRYDGDAGAGPSPPTHLPPTRGPEDGARRAQPVDSGPSPSKVSSSL